MRIDRINAPVLHRRKLGVLRIRKDLRAHFLRAEDHRRVAEFQVFIRKGAVRAALEHIGQADVGHHHAAELVARDRLSAQVGNVAGRHDCRAFRDKAGEVVQRREDLLRRLNARGRTGGSAVQRGAHLGIQPLKILAVRRAVHNQHRDAGLLQRRARRVVHRLGEHEVDAAADDGRRIRRRNLRQHFELRLGAVLARERQARFIAHRKHHIRKAAREHRHLLRLCVDRHFVDCNRVIGRHRAGLHVRRLRARRRGKHQERTQRNGRRTADPFRDFHKPSAAETAILTFRDNVAQHAPPSCTAAAQR